MRVGEETTPFAAGDLFMIPHGDAHEMGNGSGAPLIDGEPGPARAAHGRHLKRSRLGGGGEETRLICGYLACEAGLIRPVLAGLPRVVRVHIRNDRAGEWLENSIVHAVERASAAAPGGDVILARLAEVLFAEALQRYVSAATDGAHGLARGRGRRDGRAQPRGAASPARASVDARRARERNSGVAVGVDGAVRALPRPVADGVSRGLAARARGRGVAHVEPQCSARSRPRSATSRRRRSIARSNGASASRPHSIGARRGSSGAPPWRAPRERAIGVSQAVR